MIATSPLQLAAPAVFLVIGSRPRLHLVLAPRLMPLPLQRLKFLFLWHGNKQSIPGSASAVPNPDSS
jgi:hypothetical protein